MHCVRHGLKDRLAWSRKVLLQMFQQHDCIALVNQEDTWGIIEKPSRKYITIESLSDEEVPINYSSKISSNFGDYMKDLTSLLHFGH